MLPPVWPRRGQSISQWFRYSINRLLFQAGLLVLLAQGAGAQGLDDFLNDWQIVRPKPHNASINALAHEAGRYALACDGGLISVSGDLDQWENFLVGTVGFNDIEFLDDRFLAVGDNGAVASSPEGGVWTASSVGAPNQLNAVAKFNGSYYAVGAGGFIASTPDLAVWTVEVSSTTRSLNTIGVVNGVLHAAGDGGTLLKLEASVWSVVTTNTTKSIRSFAENGTQFMFAGDDISLTTSDGGSWLLRGHFNEGYALAYGKGRYVVAGNFGNLDYSTNGASWQSFFQYQTMGITGRVNDMLVENDEFIGVGSGGLIMRSEDGVSWSEISSTAYYRDVTGLASANGLSVAVGKSGLLWTKDEGERDWRNTNIGHYYFNDFRDVVAGDGRFVIAAMGQGVFTSENGVTWEWVQRDSTNAAMNISRLGYGNGVFVGIEGGTAIVRSTDGLTWEADVLPDNASNTRAIDYINGVFYVPGTSGKLYRSVDGVTWTEHVVPESASWWSTGFGNGLYVAIQGERLLTSADGLTWSVEIETLPIYPRDLLFSGGRFVIVGGSGGVLTSTDGTNWIEQGTSTSNDLMVVADGGSEIIAGGVAGSIVSSPSGSFWTLERGFYSGRIRGLVHGPGQFVAVGSSILVSEDGVSWEAISGGSLFLDDVVWGNGVYVAVGIHNRLLWSTNGRAWESISIPAAFEHVTFGKGYFLASTANMVYKSSDGREWTQHASVGGRSITFANDKFFMMGSGSIASSDDGATWAQYVYGGSRAATNVAFGNGIYLAGTNGASFYSSPDGVNWTLSNSVPQIGSTNIYFFDGLFWVTAGGSGLLYSSPDGVTWTKRLTGLSSAELVYDMASSGERMVAVSYSGGTSSQFYALDVPAAVGGEFSFGSLSAYEFGEADVVVVDGSTVTLSGVEVLPDGSRYLMGTFQNFLRFSPSVVVSSTSAEPTGFIAYFNGNGVVQWARTSTGVNDDTFKITAHTKRANGNLVFAGTYEGAVHFGNEGIFTIAGQLVGRFGAEVTRTGQFLWARNFGRSPTIEFGISGIAIGQNGNYYTSGQFLLSTSIAGTTVFNTHGSKDIYLAAHSPTFSGLWAKALPAKGVAEGRGLAIDGSDNLYLTGAVSGATTFDDAGKVTSPYYGNLDSILASYAPDGSFRWYRHYGGPQNVSIGPPLLESGGNHLTLPLAFSDRALLGRRIYEANSKYDLYALRVDTTWGNAVRISFVGSLNTSSLPIPMGTLDSRDNLFLGGLAGQGARFGSATATGDSPDNLFVTMVDDTGRRLWARFFGQDGVDRGDLQLAPLGADNLLVAGVATDSLGLSEDVLVEGGIFQATLEARSLGVVQPLAADDEAVAQPDESIVIHVLSNDEAPSGTTLSVSAIIEQPTSGVVQIVNDTVVFTAAADFSGTDRFVYRAVAPGEAGAEAEVVVAAGTKELRNGWAFEERGCNGTHLNLSQDAALNWHLGYICRPGYVHAWQDSGLWNYETIFDSTRAISGRLLSDSQGAIHVVFYDPGVERFRYARKGAEGNDWIYEVLYESDNLVTRFNEDVLAMALDSNNEPHLFLGRNDGD